MNITTATLFLASLVISSSVEMAKATSFGDEFYAVGKIDVDSTIEGNTDIVGAHLHTGSSTTNGPVNIILCGGRPMPGVLHINGPCQFQERDGADDTEEAGRYIKNLDVYPDDIEGGYTNGANNATAVAGATTLADGAPTTLDSFKEELLACTVDECNVYINIHTNYSFNLNAGAYGLARGQLFPTECIKEKLKPRFNEGTAKCFNAIATSNNTNLVTGIPNQLAENAGEFTPLTGEVMVVYQGGNRVEDSDVPIDDSASVSLSSSLSMSLIIGAAVTMSTLLLSPFMMLL